MVDIACIKTIVTHLGVNYPIFSGSLEASQLANLADVPSYAPADSNETIATRLWNPLYQPGVGTIAMGAASGSTIAPMADSWQRPRNAEKVAAIQQYHANRGQIMSNPIILAAKTPLPGGAQITPHIIQGSPQNGSQFCNLEIVRANGNGNEPLIIIDGQHRLSGLNRGVTVDEKVPFILLFDDEYDQGNRVNNLYAPEYIAETFAIVSTTPTMLEEPHNSWMQFTFGLPQPARYQPPAATNLRKAFETGLWLGCQTQFPTAAALAAAPGGPAPRANMVFRDNIGFNPNVSYGYMDEGGFAWQIHNFADIVNTWYYEQGGPLDPEDLASQVSWAFEALRAWDLNDGADSKIFPGVNSDSIKPLILGILRGMLQYIRTTGGHPSFSEWQDHIRDYLVNPGRAPAFAGAPGAGVGLDWTFAGGRMPIGDETASSQVNWTRDIARLCLIEYLSAPAPLGVGFIDYLYGSNAEITFTASLPTPTRRPSGNGQYTDTYNVPVAPKNSTTPLPGAAFNMQNGVGGAPYREIIQVQAASNNMILRARFVSVVVGGIEYDATGIANNQSGFDIASLIGMGAALPAFGSRGGITFTIGITNFTGRTERFVTRTVQL